MKESNGDYISSQKTQELRKLAKKILMFGIVEVKTIVWKDYSVFIITVV